MHFKDYIKSISPKKIALAIILILGLLIPIYIDFIIHSNMPTIVYKEWVSFKILRGYGYGLLLLLAYLIVSFLEKKVYKDFR